MLHLVDIRATFLPDLGKKSGVILETEGSIWKIQKNGTFSIQKVKKDTPNLTSRYVDSIFTIVLIK